MGNKIKSFMHFNEAGRFNYSGATWKYIVIDPKTNRPVEPFEFHDRQWQAEKKAKEINGKVKKTRY